VLAVAGSAGGCGRAQGDTDRELTGLVEANRPADKPIDVTAATKDPAELGHALTRPYQAIATTTTVRDGASDVEHLGDQAVLELGAGGAFHGRYDNDADYGREALFLPATAATGSGSAAIAEVPGALFVRPRYQRWHGRAPNDADEPAALRDQYAAGIAATWELVAPGVELTDRGPREVAGRAGRAIELHRAPTPRPLPAEPLAQRAWRLTRTIDAVDGTVVLDADRGAPLAVDLTATVGFVRDGHKFTMAVELHSKVTAIGPVALTAPAADDVVATPERRREVDDRDYLLQGIAPPLRHNADGTAVAPQPAAAPGPAAAVAPAPAEEPKKKKKHKKRDDDAPSSAPAPTEPPAP
jgi:hypothetical protein